MIVRYNEWIAEAGRMYGKQWLNWILLCLLLGVIVIVPVIAGIAVVAVIAVAMFGAMPRDELRALFSAFEHNDTSAIQQFFSNQPAGENALALVLLVLLLVLVVSLVVSLIVPPLYAGAFHAAFNQMRTGELRIGDMFKGFQVFWQSVLGVGVVGSLVLIGIMFCVIPGIYIAICAVFMMPLIMERRMGFWQAFTESRAMVHRDFLNFAVYFILASIIAGIAGYVFPLLGFITYPFYFLMISVAARDTFGLGAPAGQGSAPAPGAGYAYPPPAQTYAPPQQQHIPQPPPAGQQIYCANCRVAIPAGSAFCPFCGSPCQR